MVKKAKQKFCSEIVNALLRKKQCYELIFAGRFPLPPVFRLGFILISFEIFF